MPVEREPNPGRPTGAGEKGNGNPGPVPPPAHPDAKPDAKPDKEEKDKN